MAPNVTAEQPTSALPSHNERSAGPATEVEAGRTALLGCVDRISACRLIVRPPARTSGQAMDIASLTAFALIFGVACASPGRRSLRWLRGCWAAARRAC